MKNYPGAGWLLVGMLSGGVQAQTGIETLVVTGERYNLAPGVQQLNSDQQMPGSRADAAELLQGMTGLQADSRANFAQDTRIVLRGFGARSAFGVRGLVLQIDGIPLTMPDGQGQFSGVELDGVTQVSLLTGPLAALYGNAAGGVINLQSSAPQANRLQLDTAADEDGLARQHALGEYHEDALSARLQASHLNADGNRPHASAERNQLGAQVYYQFDDGLQAQWRFDKEDAPLLQDPLGLTQAQWQADPYQRNSSAEFFNTRKTIAQEQNAFSLRQEQGDQRWQLGLWAGERDIEQYLALKGDALASAGGVVDLRREFSGGNGNYTRDFSLAGMPASLTLGGEWSAMNDRRRGYVNNAGVAGDLRRDELDQADNRDAYSLLQWQLTDAWQWLLGARYMRLQFAVKDDFIIPGKNADDSGARHFSGNAQSLATRYQLNPAWSLHAAAGKGFESPTLTEMAYSNSDSGFNRLLDGAHNRQQELGLDYRQQALSLSLVAFHISTRNELVVDQSNNGRTTYRNAAATGRKGLELGGQYQLSAAWDGRIAINYVDASYTQGQWQGLQLPGVAKLNQYAQLNWRPWQTEQLRFSLSANHRSAVAASDNNQLLAPAYSTLDLSAAGRSDWNQYLHSQWWVKLANLNNENYVGSVIVNQSTGRAFESASGRYLAAGISLGVDY